MATVRQSNVAQVCREDAANESLDRDLLFDRPCETGWIRSDSPGSILISTIEREIIPRLVLAHKSEPASVAVPNGEARQLGADDVVEFSILVLEAELAVASSYVRGLLEQGVSLESIFMELFAPAARRLGELWVADLCDFTQVTIGVGRLQQLLREFAGSGGGDLASWQQGRRALLAPTPGEQHTFGMLMVGEYLRRAGWDVTGEPGTSRKGLCDLVRGEWFGVLGLSLSCERRLKTLSQDILAIRRASRNAGIGIMVGGRIFVEHPDYAEDIGADAMAVDGHQAIEKAGELLARHLPARSGI